MYNVVAAGAGTITYQWRTNGVNLSNNSHYAGCTTATLLVTNAQSADAVNYTCVVTADCGASTSFQAALTVATNCGATTLLNGSQRGSLSIGLQHIAGLLDEVERVLVVAESRSPFNRIVADLTPPDAGVVRDYVERIRRAMLAAAARHGLDVQGYTVGARKAIDVQALSASITVEEMRPRRLRGYGALDPRAAEEVDRTCDELERVIRELQLFIGGGEEGDYAGRLARLAGTTDDPDILPTLQRVIREHGLVEFRALRGRSSSGWRSGRSTSRSSAA